MHESGQSGVRMAEYCQIEEVSQIEAICNPDTQGFFLLLQGFTLRHGYIVFSSFQKHDPPK